MKTTRWKALCFAGVLCGCGAMPARGPSPDQGKVIDQMQVTDFHFGPMAMGQVKDVNHAHAEGLGLVPDAAMEGYLNGILAKLLAQAPTRGVPAHAYVRASRDWDAKTTADANIYISVGMLLRLDNEDEVAALLAHEASHVLLGHADADALQSVQQRAIQLSAIALAVRDQVDHGRREGPAEKGSDDARVKEQTKALLASTLVAMPAWNREQERLADLLGTDLLARSGYNPEATLSLLRKQVEYENARKSDPQAQYLEQQLSAFGIDAVEKTRKRTQKKVESDDIGQRLLGSVTDVGLDQALQWGSQQLNELQRSHPHASDRLVDAQAYVQREYPGSSATFDEETWEDAKDASADVLENYIAAIKAEEQLFAGELSEAGELSRQSIAGATGDHSYPNYVDAAVRRARGETRLALRDYETALASPAPAGAIYVEASALYLESGDRRHAEQVIATGYARLQQPPTLAVPLIHVYRVVGKQSEADRVAAECALRWPKMQDACLQEAKGEPLASR